MVELEATGQAETARQLQGNDHAEVLPAGCPPTPQHIGSALQTMAWLQILIGACPVVGSLLYLAGSTRLLGALLHSRAPRTEIALGLAITVTVLVVLDHLPQTRSWRFSRIPRLVISCAGTLVGGSFFWSLLIAEPSSPASTSCAILLGITALGLVLSISGLGLLRQARWAGLLQRAVSLLLLPVLAFAGLRVAWMTQSAHRPSLPEILAIGGIATICALAAVASALLVLSGPAIYPRVTMGTAQAGSSSPASEAGLRRRYRALALGVRLQTICLAAAWIVMMHLLWPAALEAAGVALQKVTTFRLHTLAFLATTYADDTGSYPLVGGIDELSELLVPDYYLVELPVVDGWGWPLEYHAVDRGGFVIRSPGADGRFEIADPLSYEEGTFSSGSYESDIVVSTVSGSRWPEGLCRPYHNLTR